MESPGSGLGSFVPRNFVLGLLTKWDDWQLCLGEVLSCVSSRTCFYYFTFVKEQICNKNGDIAKMVRQLHIYPERVSKTQLENKINQNKINEFQRNKNMTMQYSKR